MTSCFDWWGTLQGRLNTRFDIPAETNLWYLNCVSELDLNMWK
jgi:hypothetical protein